MDARQELKSLIKRMMNDAEKASVILGSVINVNLAISRKEKSMIVYGILEEIRLEEMKSNVKGITLQDKARFEFLVDQVNPQNDAKKTDKAN